MADKFSPIKDTWEPYVTEGARHLTGSKSEWGLEGILALNTQSDIQQVGSLILETAGISSMYLASKPRSTRLTKGLP